MQCQCEVCNEKPAVFRFTATDMDGTVLDSIAACRECATYTADTSDYSSDENEGRFAHVQFTVGKRD